MTKSKVEEFGTKPVGKLIIEQSVPAAIGILVMSLNMLVDTIFVGNWIGTTAIAAITVVLPIIFLISSVGMAIGIGGSSMVSRALGSDNIKKALDICGNQIAMSFGISMILLILGLIFRNDILFIFGAKGGIIQTAEGYYTTLMFVSPFLALAMTGNPVIRAEGKPKFSMVAMILPAIANIILDALLIYYYDFGMVGAAWATTISYIISFAYTFWFFRSKYTRLRVNLKCIQLQSSIIKEISAIGGVTLARQGVVSALSIVLNHTLFAYGGELSIAVYGIISRVLSFALFPIQGITQGFMPIVGYNYGANNYERLQETVKKSILYGSMIALLIFIVIVIFPLEIVMIFTNDTNVLENTPNALRIIFAVTPLIAVQLIGSAYFQSIGKVKPALLLTLTKQGFS